MYVTFVQWLENLLSSKTIGFVIKREKMHETPLSKYLICLKHISKIYIYIKDPMDGPRGLDFSKRTMHYQPLFINVCNGLK